MLAQHVARFWPPCCDMFELVRMPWCNIVAGTLLNDRNIHKCQLHEKFDQFQIGANNTQHVATSRNTYRQDGQTRATRWAQQCCDMLR